MIPKLKGLRGRAHLGDEKARGDTETAIADIGYRIRVRGARVARARRLAGPRPDAVREQVHVRADAR